MVVMQMIDVMMILLLLLLVLMLLLLLLLLQLHETLDSKGVIHRRVDLS